ncbi:Protein BATH-23 [Aphelenchoides avenae]|nr:Protein BATH-23 [Aphelenchus avenae]
MRFVSIERPSKRRRFENVKIILRDAAVYANKGVLAAHSEDFETMFFGEFAERGKDEVELKDVDAADFQCFKDLTHPPHAAVDDTNVASVVYMADKYRAATMLQKCEEAIMSRMDPTDAFKVPSGLGLDQVFPLNPIYCRAQILRAMTDEELDEFSEADVYGALSKQTIWVLMHEYKNRRDNA